MNHLTRHENSRTAPPASRLAASAAMVTLAVAGALAAIVAGTGSAAAAVGADEPSHPSAQHPFPHATLTRGQLRVKGTHVGDEIALRLQAGDPATLQVDVGDDGSADFSFERAAVAEVAVDARAGDDLVRIDDGNGPVALGIPTTLDGGDGDDSLGGGVGAETLLGGDGDDAIDGNGGADTGLLGAGDDTFVWDPGDGSDVVEGQEGADTMRFNGAGGAEQVDLSANGTRLRFFRTQGTITMDTAGVERVDFNALGGADLVTVNDLSGTDVNVVSVDLAGTLGGATGDGQIDRIVVNGTDGEDAITVQGDPGVVKASGLSATVAVLHAEAANDRLEINTLDGSDTVDADGLAAGAIQLLVDGIPVP